MIKLFSKEGFESTHSVYAGAPYLLIILFECLGRTVVDDPANVRLVDTHPKGHSCHNHCCAAVQECHVGTLPVIVPCAHEHFSKVHMKIIAMCNGSEIYRVSRGSV